MVVLLAAVVVLFATGVLPPERDERAARRGVFPVSTDRVLVFDDGYDGIALVDLDRRVVVRRPVRGQRAGDAPYRLFRAGDALIAGWGEVYAAPLDGSRPRSLGDATIAIPAADDDTVWLVDYPGGRIGKGTPTLREVDLEGDVIREGRGLDPRQYSPVIGVTTGVAHQTVDGVSLFDLEKRRAAKLGRGLGWPADVREDLLAWCDGGCASYHLTHVRTGRQVDAPGVGGAFDFGTARFSPDGKWLAATADGRLILIDTETGEPRPVSGRGIGQDASLAWGSDTRVFFAARDGDTATTNVGTYDLESGSLTAVALPIGATTSLVAVERGEVESLLRSEIGPSGDCTAPTEQPSGRKGPCSFKF